MNNDYVNLSDQLPVETVLEFLSTPSDHPTYAYWDGVIRVKKTSLRYDALRKSPQCVTCATNVNHAILQKHPNTETNSGHFNFYTQNNVGFSKTQTPEGVRLRCRNCSE
jgi:hypothetical protein